MNCFDVIGIFDSAWLFFSLFHSSFCHAHYGSYGCGVLGDHRIDIAFHGYPCTIRHAKNFDLPSILFYYSV